MSRRDGSRRTTGSSVDGPLGPRDGARGVPLGLCVVLAIAVPDPAAWRLVGAASVTATEA